jgi:hypothetical protein
VVDTGVGAEICSEDTYEEASFVADGLGLDQDGSHKDVCKDV